MQHNFDESTYLRSAGSTGDTMQETLHPTQLYSNYRELSRSVAVSVFLAATKQLVYVGLYFY